MILTTKDYLYCEECETYLDFWKYDHDINDTDHGLCHGIREVTEEELKQCIKDCKEDGCFDEVEE